MLMVDASKAVKTYRLSMSLGGGYVMHLTMLLLGEMLAETQPTVVFHDMTVG